MDAVKAILKAKAEVNAKDNDECTPLNLALQGRKAIIEMLEDAQIFSVN